MRQIMTGTVVLLSVLARGGSSHGGAGSQEIPSSLILDRFAVSKSGDILLVPVSVAEKDYLFMVDTGATDTFFDTMFRLGEPIDVVATEGAEGNVEVKLFRPPDARIGRTPFGPVDAVAVDDHSLLRQISGYPVMGTLGMDFLGKHVVHIDIEKGELMLLKSAPATTGVELPISWEPGVHPTVAAGIGPTDGIRFAIDTGFVSPYSGSLGILEIMPLIRSGTLRDIGKDVGVSMSGTFTRSLFQGSDLTIGRFTVKLPIVSESRGTTPNRLSLGFWSRFAVTFDFPARRVHLRKSASFGRPDYSNATGLHIWKKGDSIEVSTVDAGSPAARAGLIRGDVLVEVNGIKAATASLFDIRNELCTAGQLACVVRRNSRERRFRIR